MKIPDHLSHLPTVRGMAVPYVASWTSEDVDTHRAELRACPQVGVPAWFTYGAAGDGEPMLGKMNMVRQRECWLDNLCQVCARPGAPFLLMAEPFTVVDGMGEVATEPPVCALCAAYAMAVCPGVKRGPMSAYVATGPLCASSGIIDGVTGFGVMWVKQILETTVMVDPATARVEARVTARA